VTDDELIQREIEADALRPGPANVRLRRSGVPVWALIGYFNAANGDEDIVARDYELSRDEVSAAIAYYKQHRPEIDGRIEDSELRTVG
jgi:uncharacterized protein (DUF433 family)